MKLEHFYSDWNGMQSKTPYHTEPSKQTLQQATTLGKVRVGNCMIFVKDSLCEVRNSIENGFNGNTYRDMYRIIR